MNFCALAHSQSIYASARDWFRAGFSYSVSVEWVGHVPLLEELESGLILASGHYRNGVLLTPATAEWVATALEQRSLEQP